MDKIKIAFVIDKIDEVMGGTERQLMLFLKHIDRTRFEPVLGCLQETSWINNHFNNSQVYNIGFQSFFSISDWCNLIRFASYLRREKVAIVQTHFRDGNIVGILAAKLAGVPLIVSTRRNQGYWHNKRELLVLKILNQAVDHWLANSKAIRSYVQQEEGVPEDRIKVIYNGIDLKKYIFRKEELRKDIRLELQIDPDELLVVQVANLRPVKATDILLKAAQKVIHTVPKARFVVIGNGPEWGSLQAKIFELGLDRCLQLLGNRDDVPRILAAADLGVLSSYSEGLSNSIIEYMAAGLPVVCCDVGGNRELVNENNGILVKSGSAENLADAIQQLLRQHERRKEMGVQSRLRVEVDFLLEVSVKKHEDFYVGLLNQIN